MKVNEAIAAVEQQLSSSQNSRSDSRLLVAAILGINPTDIYLLAKDARLTAAQQQDLSQRLKRMATAEPFDYIVGYKMFRGVPITINHDVLIPRPETEQLVQLVLDSPLLVKASHVLEVGVGSGCIGVTLMLQSAHLGYKHISYTGVDKSAHALAIARINFEQALHIQLDNFDQSPNFASSQGQIRLANLPASELAEIDGNSPDIIVANPPYGTHTEMMNLPDSVKGFEPLMAIAGGEDGLDVFRDIAKYIHTLEKKPALFMEIGPAIAETCKTIFDAEYSDVKILPDLFGRKRFLVATA